MAFTGSNITRLAFFFASFLLLSAFIHPEVSSGGNEDAEKENKDTVRAIVLYGSKFLIKPSVELSNEIIVKYVDSLFRMKDPPQDLIDQINCFLTIREKTDEDIYSMIDSLFELEKVPYALINQINYFVATRSGSYEDDGSNLAVAITAFYDDSEFPANCFYDSWDTEITHPYTDELWKEDSSSTVLVLQDSMNFCNYIHPHKGVVTSHFGHRNGRPHNGIDVNLRTGDPVHAAFDGKVRIARNHGGYGNVVVVRHYNGLETLYAHLHRIKVKPGQEIAAGQLVGLGGNTGRSTGSHLHFEIRFKGKPINPKHLIDFNAHKLHCDAIVLHKTKWSYAAFPEGASFHTVERGEYMYEIAERYGLTIKQLCHLNGLSRKTVLKVGQKLRIF